MCGFSLTVGVQSFSFLEPATEASRGIEKSSRQVSVRKAIKLKDEAKNGKKTYGCEVAQKFKERHDKKIELNAMHIFVNV